MRSLLLATVFVCFNASIAAAETETANKGKFPGIKSLMTNAEFQASGLNKLSESEIAELNAWLLKYTANKAPILRKNVAEVKQEASKEIRSRIDGKFSGWSGKTVFRLQNGQVWQQRYSGKWKTQLDNPEVVISRNFFGFYELKLVDQNRSIGVKRVK